MFFHNLLSFCGSPFGGHSAAATGPRGQFAVENVCLLWVADRLSHIDYLFSIIFMVIFTAGLSQPRRFSIFPRSQPKSSFVLGGGSWGFRIYFPGFSIRSISIFFASEPASFCGLLATFLYSATLHSTLPRTYHYSCLVVTQFCIRCNSFQESCNFPAHTLCFVFLSYLLLA